MTPARIDRDTVIRRLQLMEAALADLRQLEGITAARLDSEALTRAAAERLLQVLVDLAFDVNGHIAVAELGRAPETGRQSFLDMATAGILAEDLAASLAPSAGLRNVLVHHYVDVRTDLVAESVASALELFPAYVGAVARRMAG